VGEGTGPSDAGKPTGEKIMLMPVLRATGKKRARRPGKGTKQKKKRFIGKKSWGRGKPLP